MGDNAPGAVRLVRPGSYDGWSCPVAAWSEPARELLAQDPVLRFHSVFREAVNLRCGGRLVTCTDLPLRAPHGIEVAEPGLALLSRLGRDDPSATVRCRLDGPAEAPAGSAGAAPHLFDPTVPHTGPAALQSGLSSLRQHVLRARPLTGFGDDWSALLTRTELNAAVRSVRAGVVDESVLGWLGRGPGLTPSGDDVLVGAITTLAGLGALDAEALRRLGVRLESAARERTTDVAAEYLHYACRGMAAGGLRTLLTALGGAGPPAIEAAAERLRRHGHTSGADGLLGVLLALTVVASDLGHDR